MFVNKSYPGLVFVRLFNPNHAVPYEIISDAASA